MKFLSPSNNPQYINNYFFRHLRNDDKMAIFQWIESWLSSDILHFNLFVGMTPLLSLASVILFSIIFKKIGTNDIERLRIKLQISYTMYTSLLVLLAIFILWMPTNTIYLRQYLIMIISISLLFGSISGLYHMLWSSYLEFPAHLVGITRFK